MVRIWKLEETIYFGNKEVPNEGFTVSIVSAPGYGESGKVSAMACNITKDGVFSETIEVDSNLLIGLIKQKKIDKGVFEGTYSIASVNGCKCFINDTMEEWQQAKKDMRFRKLPKTSKYKVGRNYKTLTMDELYLGDIYKVCEINLKSRYNANGEYDPSYSIVPLNKPMKASMMLDIYNAKNYRQYTNLIRNCKTVLEYINIVKSLVCQNSFMYDEVMPNFINSKPSRVEGELRLIDNATKEDWRDLLDTIIIEAARSNVNLGRLKSNDELLCYNITPELVDYTDRKYEDLLNKLNMTQDYKV